MSRIAFATDKTINNAKLVVNLQDVEGKEWSLAGVEYRLFGHSETPYPNNHVAVSENIAGNVATYDLGNVPAGSKFTPSQSIPLSIAELTELTKPAADGIWSNAFMVNARLTGDLAPGSTEDCKNTFGYEDATTKAGVPVDPTKVGEFTFPADTKYTVDNDDLPEGWTAVVDPDTGKLTVTPPADAEEGDFAEVTVTATPPNGTPETTTVTVTVKDDNGAPGAGTCVAAGLTVGLPLLLLVPVGMAGQLNIPGLDQLNADLQAQLRNANSQLQQQFGIFDPAQAQYINQINSEIARFTADNRTIINGAAMVALGLLAAAYLYNSCVGEDGTSSMSSLSSGSSE
ncbi:hypothetical protein HCH15_11085 [Corynebacterium testudinoris]|nr:hypothetical protein [Corynebacterium testudinoris]